MVAKEYNNQAGVYKVQTFGTLQINSDNYFEMNTRSLLRVGAPPPFRMKNPKN